MENVGIWQWDVLKDELILDKTSIKLLELPKQILNSSLCLHDYLKLIPHFERRKIKACLLKKAASAGAKYRIEHGLNNSSSPDKQLLNIGHVSTYKEGNQTILKGYITPFVESKVLNDDQQAEQISRQVANTVPVGIFISIHNNFTYVNAGMTRLTGYAQQELLSNKHFSNIVHPEDVEAVTTTFQQLNQEPESKVYSKCEYRLRHKNGRILFVQMNCRPTTYREKPAIIGTLTDISERRNREIQLEESAEKYKVLANQHIFGLYILTGERITFINKKAASILGYHPAELTGKSILDLDLMVNLDEFKNRLYLRRKNIQTSFKFETKMRKKAGEVITVQISSGTIPYGNHAALLGVIEDITEQKLNQKKLAASEAHQRALLNALPDMFVHLDRRGTYLQIHIPKTFDTLVDAKRDIGKTLYETVPSKLARKVHKSTLLALDEGKKTTITYTIDGNTGTRHREARIAPVDTDSAIMIIQDITDQIMAQQKLIASEKKLRLFLKQLPALMWTTDTDLRLTSIMGSALNLLGINPGSIVGEILFEHLETTDKFFIPISKHFEALNGNSVSFNQSWLDYDFQTTIEPLTDDSGDIIGTIALAFDITEMEQARQKLKKSLKEKEVLLSEIHDRVKNNLSLITSIMELQIAAYEGNRIKEILTDSKNRISAIASIHEILYSAKDFTDVRFDAYLNILIQSFTQQYTEITFETNLKTVRLPITQAIPCGLIANELITNAIKHGTPDIKPPIVGISLYQESNTAVLKIRDYGTGLSSSNPLDDFFSLGFTLIQRLVLQLEAAFSYTYEEGTIIEIRFSIERN